MRRVCVDNVYRFIESKQPLYDIIKGETDEQLCVLYKIPYFLKISCASLPANPSSIKQDLG